MKRKINIILLFALCCCLPFGLLAQQKNITGLVTDGSGNPVDGVTVSIADKTTQTNTDDGGRYSLQAAPGNTLVFTSMGYLTEEHLLQPDELVVNIRLIESTEDLGEVVVVGYGRQKKESVVASISTVTAKELAVTGRGDRKSTRLNSSHVKISYAVFCLKKKNKYTSV